MAQTQNIQSLVTFRNLDTTDAAQLISLYSKEIMKNFGQLQECPDLKAEQAYIARMNQSESDILKGIEYDGRLIGTLGLHEIDECDKSTRLGIIIWDKDYHKKGVGTYAIESLIKFVFEESRIEKIYVNVLTNTKTERFYRQFGFRVERILENHYSLKGKKEDMLHMVLYKHE